MPNPYRWMWMLVFYDLPVDNADNRRAAVKFHGLLEDQGFERMQFSVYRRFCGSTERVDTFRRRIESNLPKGGNVRLLVITDRQFGLMRIYEGNKKYREPRTRPAQYEMF